MDTAQVMQQIGINIKRYRKGRGLTLEALAQKTIPHTTRGTISKYETGKSPNMTIDTLNALANALEVKPQDLLVNWSEEDDYQQSLKSLKSIITNDDLGVTPEELKILQQIDLERQLNNAKEKYLLLLTILRIINGGEYQAALDELISSFFPKDN
jgi:transcriptional regulator with XRE-family HTH domain